MSAGGLSYSGLTNYGRATLPSVETWGSNMNILRDPPKSVTTRRIDKVGQTSDITQMTEDSGNRACEAINVYARGVNPMVSVSYSNNGRGGASGSLTGLSQNFTNITTGNTQATLPYKAMNEGAFRPPVRRAEDLMPLSRQPRAWTNAFTQPGMVDYSKSIRVLPTAEQSKEIQKTIKTNVRPTAVYKLEKPMERPIETKYHIQSSINNSASSGTRTMNITQQHVGVPVKELHDDPLHAVANANVGDSRNFVNDNNNIDMNSYIQDISVKETFTNVSSNNSNATSITEIMDLSEINMPIKESINITRNAPLSGVEQNNYVHDDMILTRNLPEYYTTTNTSTAQNYQRMEHNDRELERNIPTGSYATNTISRGDTTANNGREAFLIPKIQAGGFDGRGTVPELASARNYRESINTEKSNMSKQVLAMGQERFEKPAPWSR
jgi:hypothetical protein